MIEYRYRALDERGKPVEGAMEAESAQAVVDRLRSTGMTVNSVTEPTGPETVYPRKAVLGVDDLILLNEQLHAITKSGLPLAPALEVLGRDVRSARLRQVLDTLRSDLESGRSLEEAVDRQPAAFPLVYRSLVRAGARSGNLSRAFALLAAYSTRNAELVNRVQEAIVYPLIVMVAGCSVMGYFLVKAIPAVATGTARHVFGDYDLPWFTRYIVNSSNYLCAHWQGMLFGTVLFVVLLAGAYLALRARTEGRRALESLKLRVPFFGGLFRDVTMSRFARTLSMLQESRMPLPESLHLAGAASGSMLLEEATGKAAVSVSAGNRLSESLDATGLFPHTMCWLLRMGEDRGTMLDSVREAAEAHERAAERRGMQLVATLRPALTVVAAVVIGFALLAVYRPMIVSFFTP